MTSEHQACGLSRRSLLGGAAGIGALAALGGIPGSGTFTQLAFADQPPTPTRWS